MIVGYGENRMSGHISDCRWLDRNKMYVFQGPGGQTYWLTENEVERLIRSKTVKSRQLRDVERLMRKGRRSGR